MEQSAVDRIKELLKDVTPLPWEMCSCGTCGMVFGDGGNVYVHYPPDWEVVGPVSAPQKSQRNAELIALSVSNVSGLIDEVERLKAEIEWTKTLLGFLLSRTW